MRVLGISGSLRRDSLNDALLRAAAERLPAGAELVRFDRLADVPPFSEDAESSPAPDAVRELREAIRAADAVLIATPEYNHSLPGQLKNALDWASRPAGQSSLTGKPAAAIGASKSMFGAVWAQAELPVGQAHEHLVGGRLELEPGQSEQLEEILAKLLAAAEAEVGLEPVAA